MKIKSISIGKKNDPELSGAVLDYTSRISKYISADWILISNDEEKEAESVLKNIGDGDFLVALDEKGKEMDTIELSQFLEKRMIAGEKNIIFVIGGSYGLDQLVLDRADHVWSLSKLTFPHQIARLLLAEAVYRAFSVIKNEKYHHV